MNSTIQCPSCLKTTDIAHGVCTCGFQLPQESMAIIRPIRRQAKIPVAVRIAIFIDSTGSAAPFADGVKMSIKQILEPISKKAKETKVYLFTGGDLDYNQECNLICDGVTAEEAIRATQSLTFSGGGDVEETHIDSLETVLKRTPWEVDFRKYRNALVVFTTADSKPARSGVTPSQLGSSLKQIGISTYLVAEDVPFTQELSHASGALYFPISNNPDPAEMQQIAANISKSILMAATSSTQLMPKADRDNNVIDLEK